MPASSANYSLGDEVRLVESVLFRKLLPDERFHVIGHSYGGMVALQLAAGVRSHRLRSVSVYEPIDFHLLPIGDPDREIVEAIWHEIEERLNAGDSYGSASCFVDYWNGAGAFAQLREPRQRALAALVPKILLERRAVADESRDLEAYRRIDAPVCLVAGRSSPVPAGRLFSMFAEMLPHANRFEIAAGHMAPITHPELINPIFEEFIREVDEAGYRHVSKPLPFAVEYRGFSS